MTTESITSEQPVVDRTRTRLRLGAGGVIVLIGLLYMIGGIGAFSPQTSETEHIGPTENASSTTLGTLRLDDVYVSAPAGGTATLRLAVDNQGASTDRLLGVTATASSATTDAATLHPLSPTAGQMINLDNSGAGIPLRVNHTVTAGTDLTIHFQFARAGGVSLAVPVVAPTTAPRHGH